MYTFMEHQTLLSRKYQGQFDLICYNPFKYMETEKESFVVKQDRHKRRQKKLMPITGEEERRDWTAMLMAAASANR